MAAATGGAAATAEGTEEVLAVPLAVEAEAKNQPMWVEHQQSRRIATPRSKSTPPSRISKPAVAVGALRVFGFFVATPSSLRLQTPSASRLPPGTAAKARCYTSPLRSRTRSTSTRASWRRIILPGKPARSHTKSKPAHTTSTFFFVPDFFFFLFFALTSFSHQSSHHCHLRRRCSPTPLPGLLSQISQRHLSHPYALPPATP